MSARTDAVFRAISNRRRREILELVHRRPRTASEIAREFEVTWPAISRHLRLLTQAGLLRREGDSDARARFSVDVSALKAAQRWLAGLAG